MAKRVNPVLLIVLDGWGHSDINDHNAIRAAHTPVWDELWSRQPHTLISCSGTDVGLPDEQMGNSEVGHMHIGAGRLIDQDFSSINKAIESGEFARNPALLDAFSTASENARAVHILGLLSPGGVHSHEDHIIALIDLAHRSGAARIFVHAFLDGRDTPPESALASLQRVESHCVALGTARIASIVGRYYAMDRNHNYERTARAYRLIIDAQAEHHAEDPTGGLTQAYTRGETDEFVAPTLIHPRNQGPHKIADGDVVVFANFRSDRARQLTSALTKPDFDGFERDRVPALGRFVMMTDYGDQFALPVAFPATDIENTFGAVVAARGLKQLRIAETEKYAHVTFFFNGGKETEFPGEDRVMIPSPDVATYDLQPQMNAAEVTSRLCEALGSKRYDAIICNYANADMVGHTGNFDATVRCIETLDECLGRVIAVARQQGVDVLITADHGNAEMMRVSAGNDGSTNPHTAHTSNLVPLVYVGRAAIMAGGGTLADLAPTLLGLMGLPAPVEMTGRCLVTVTPTAENAA